MPVTRSTRHRSPPITPADWGRSSQRLGKPDVDNECEATFKQLVCFAIRLIKNLASKYSTETKGDPLAPIQRSILRPARRRSARLSGKHTVVYQGQHQ